MLGKHPICDMHAPYENYGAIFIALVWTQRMRLGPHLVGPCRFLKDGRCPEPLSITLKQMDCVSIM
mgnify:CR=1 FL=1